MTTQRLNALVATVLIAANRGKGTVLDGTVPSGVPNGHIYAQLMGEVDIDTWTTLINELIRCGLITEQNYLIKCTERGAAAAQRLEDILVMKGPL